jgi:hypothetical protein
MPAQTEQRSNCGLDAAAKDPAGFDGAEVCRRGAPGNFQ